MRDDQRYPDPQGIHCKGDCPNTNLTYDPLSKDWWCEECRSKLNKVTIKDGIQKVVRNNNIFNRPY